MQKIIHWFSKASDLKFSDHDRFKDPIQEFSQSTIDKNGPGDTIHIGNGGNS